MEFIHKGLAMNFQDAIVTCFKKYVDINGRALRSEYWWFVLFNIICLLVLQMIWMPLAYLFALVTLLPSITVGVRRLHDVNKSGLFLFLALIPLIGALILIFWFVQEGSKGNNDYGLEPVKTKR